MKGQEEKILLRTPEYEDMPSTRGRLWLYPNSTDPLMVHTAKMFKLEKQACGKLVMQESLILYCNASRNFLFKQNFNLNMSRVVFER